jgi:uncharacterized protein (UPF0333 family)
MDMRGQGAIEYLLIIGAAILVIAVVIIALTSVTTAAGDSTDTNTVNDALDPLCVSQCTAYGTDYDLNTDGFCVNSSDPTDIKELTGNC